MGELKNLRATLKSTILKSQPADMKRNLKAVKIAVQGRLRSLARQDRKLGIYLESARPCGNEDLIEESQRLLKLIDQAILSKEDALIHGEWNTLDS